MREMEQRMADMEKMYKRQLLMEVRLRVRCYAIGADLSLQREQNELKTDAKIDMMRNAGIFGSPTKSTFGSPVKRVFGSPVRKAFPAPRTLSEAEEEDVEMSLVCDPFQFHCPMLIHYADGGGRGGRIVR